MRLPPLKSRPSGIAARSTLATGCATGLTMPVLVDLTVFGKVLLWAVAMRGCPESATQGVAKHGQRAKPTPVHPAL